MASLWNDSYLIGVEKVDNQHKELFKRVETLFNACNQGKGRDEVAGILQFLQDYVVEHFKSEEELQLKYDYPEYVSHKAMHEAFVKDFLELKKGFEANGTNGLFVIQVNKKVINWLTQHVAKVDKALGLFLKDKIK
jgi:hemerythrin